MKLPKVSTRNLVLYVLLKFPETPIKTIKERLEEDYDRDISRTRVEQILDDLKRQDIVTKEKGVKDRRQTLCSINPNKIDGGFFTVIKDSKKTLVYDEYAETIYDTQCLHKIEHNLPDELDEIYDKLKIIRDSFFNRDPPAIETDKVRGFNDWGPDRQKLMEHLHNALWASSGLVH